MKPSYFADVEAFHSKFDLPRESEPLPPAPLAPDVLSFRIAFMLEELAEFCESQGAVTTAAALRKTMKDVREFSEEVKDATISITGLADGGDALVDLIYVALGTAHMMRLPFEQMWDEVQRANMAKARATSAGDARSKRGHSLDVVKPAGWRGPDHWPLIYARASGYQYQAPSVRQTDVREKDDCYCIGRLGHVRGTPGCLHHTKHL